MRKLMLIISVLSVFLASCSKDFEFENHEIEDQLKSGTWSKTEVLGIPNNLAEVDPSGYIAVADLISFTANDVEQKDFYQLTTSRKGMNTSLPINYKIKNRKVEFVYMCYSPIPMKYRIAELTDNTLVLEAITDFNQSSSDLKAHSIIFTKN